MKFFSNKRYPCNIFSAFIILIFSSSLFVIISCKKLVAVTEPVDSITTSEVFENEATAISSVISIYNSFRPSNASLGIQNMLSLYAGLSSDELNFFNGTDINVIQFQNNSLDATNPFVQDFWTPVYSTIYRANAVIEFLPQSTSVSDSVKNQLIGEAQFLRALCYFYLTNLFGNVPLITTTSWVQSSGIYRISQGQIYQRIISDLLDAKDKLSGDYSISSGERIRATKWAAAALLAKIYLYQQDWQEALQNSSEVISNNALYALQSDLNKVFLASNASNINKEAIWQIQVYPQSPFSCVEGLRLIPASRTSAPTWYITNQLMSAFEAGDMRRRLWVDSTKYTVSGITTVYYYPYKYKVRTASSVTEYDMILRLAEQYLIRAEAKANLNDLSGAVSDLNILRNRAGLTNLSASLSQSQVMAAIYQERQVELFSEKGDRWFDIKRTGRSSGVLGPIKPGWTNNDTLYPIPYSEIQVAPNLKQNPDY